ncbi:hypothetical protein BG841_13135 [Marinobacter sp. X15-166B]|nr:hypothetical protein BG841_13135 [Marinobacter sp. X15-166B]
MLGYLAYYNYTWFDFRVGQLPQKATVLTTERTSNFFQPWSYVIPAINYFEFIDGEFKTYQQDSERLVQYIRYEFYHDYIDRLDNKFFLLNCTQAEQLELDDAGQPIPPYKTEPVDRGSALFKKLCQ